MNRNAPRITQIYILKFLFSFFSSLFTRLTPLVSQIQSILEISKKKNTFLWLFFARIMREASQSGGGRLFSFLVFKFLDPGESRMKKTKSKASRFFCASYCQCEVCWEAPSFSPLFFTQFIALSWSTTTTTFLSFSCPVQPTHTHRFHTFLRNTSMIDSSWFSFFLHAIF